MPNFFTQFTTVLYYAVHHHSALRIFAAIAHNFKKFFLRKNFTILHLAFYASRTSRNADDTAC